MAGARITGIDLLNPLPVMAGCVGAVASNVIPANKSRTLLLPLLLLALPPLGAVGKGSSNNDTTAAGG